MAKKILVIDDSEAFQETIGAILQIEGFEVTKASNGSEGLARIYSDSPDLVLLDCVMPGIDGYDVVRAMREDSLLFNKPVIMLTGKDTEYDEIKGLELGIDDYIVKPFDPPVLISRIKAVFLRAEKLAATGSLLLSGNSAVKDEIERRIQKGSAFAAISIDLNNFKGYNERYGFQRGDEIIKTALGLFLKVVRESGSTADFVGHISGDSFMVVTSFDRAEEICKKIVELFDDSSPMFYDDIDRENGFISVKDRKGGDKKYPFINLTMVVISNETRKINHFGQLMSISAEIKKISRQSDKSSYFVDRRKK